MIIMEQYRFEKHGIHEEINSPPFLIVVLAYFSFLNPCLNSYFHRDNSIQVISSKMEYISIIYIYILNYYEKGYHAYHA